MCLYFTASISTFSKPSSIACSSVVSSPVLSDEDWMRRALSLAMRAQEAGEVPVGAILVKGNVCLGEGWNSPIATNDPSAHAEINALRRSGAVLRNYRLIDTTLYATLEPCVMCMGAIIHARVGRLVFGAYDPKRGAVESVLQLSHCEWSNHTIEWRGGVLSEPCGALLKKFFTARR